MAAGRPSPGETEVTEQKGETVRQRERKRETEMERGRRVGVIQAQ